METCGKVMMQRWDCPYTWIFEQFGTRGNIVIEWIKHAKLMSPCCSIVAQLEVKDLPCEVYFKIFTKKCHLSIKKKENLKKNGEWIWN